MPTRSPESNPAIERVVLIGYMCSGKSAVGSALARRLEWGFVDFDVEVERREGISIAELVADRGETYLRAAEAALTEELSRDIRVVLAPGGGWITQPELLDQLRPGALAVWLYASVEETVRRLRSDSIDRPLRESPDAEETVAAMLRKREPLYRLADFQVPTEGRSAEQVAFEIEQLVRYRTG